MPSLSLEALIAPLRHSPRLVEAVDLLRAQMREEQEQRERFYAEMTPEEKVEFIDGEVVPHSPAKHRHLGVTKRVVALLDAYVNVHQTGEVLSEKCLCVFPRNDYEPDVVFFGPEKAAGLDEDTMKFPVPDLIVEVLSESTEARDRGVKFEDYEAHGVGEYWIVDPEREVLEQYALRDSGYELLLKTSSGEVRSEVLRGFVAPVRALFSKEANLEALRTLAGGAKGSSAA
jgi:Uma2 family endonuclease